VGSAAPRGDLEHIQVVLRPRAREGAEPIDSPRSLAQFLDKRASFIAQTSLYGYLRTRAGMRYPELFDDDPFVEAINIAKWHVWLDCLSDITVYARAAAWHSRPRVKPCASPS
jgi:hypothetical protein